MLYEKADSKLYLILLTGSATLVIVIWALFKRWLFIDLLCNFKRSNTNC